MEDKTTVEQELFDRLKAVEDENFHLKRQLHNKNKQIRTLKVAYIALNTKYKQLVSQRKPRYKNTKKGK